VVCVSCSRRRLYNAGEWAPVRPSTYDAPVNAPTRASIALLLSFALACGGKSEPDSVPASTPPPESVAVLAVSPTAERLVQEWLDAAAQTATPPAPLKLLVIHESLGLGMLGRGEVAAAIVHRRARPAELRDASAEGVVGAGELEHRLLARDAIGIAVHAENPNSTVTREQARDLIGGSIDWSSLVSPRAPIGGGPALLAPSGPPRVYLRGEGHSSRRALDLLQLRSPIAGSVTLGSDKVLLDRLSKDPGGIGLVAAAAVSGSHGEARAKLLGLVDAEGSLVFPDAGLRGGALWPLLRPLYLVRPTNPGRVMQELVDFALTPTGKKITTTRGFLPASPVRSRRPASGPE